MSAPTPPSLSNRQKVFNLALAALAGQVGCLTLLIVALAVGGGLWLDQRFGSKPVFTLGLVVISIPVSLAVMFFVARTTISRIRSGSSKTEENSTQEAGIGKNG
ncbi:MAG: AtpZ/AtpI family protein [Longilinea sp.]|nr:AtpZ/AtpI family protein [Longilinea sp.]MCA1953774.1 AtpZ/AtpI family protein [Anaerolinea sp.]